MIIRRLRLVNFRSHADTDLPFALDKVLIVGPNGGGKSSLLDAMCYGLTGVCRGTDQGGRGAKDLVGWSWRDGEQVGTVSLEIEGAPRMTRGIGSGPKSAEGATIAKDIGFDARMVQALFRPDSFATLPDGEQSALFLSVAPKADDISGVASKWLNGLLPANIPTTLAEVDALERRVRELRPELKRQVADLERESVVKALSETYRTKPIAEIEEELARVNAAIREVKQERPDDNAKDIADLEADLRRLVGKTEAARPCPKCGTGVVVAGDRLYTEAQIAEARDGLQRALAAARKVAKPSISERSADLEVKRSELDRCLFLRRQEVERLAKIAALKDRLDRADKAVEILSAKGPLRGELAARPPATPGVDVMGIAAGLLRGCGWGELTWSVSPWRLALDNVPTALLSASQRWRLNLAVQVGLAHASGLRILVLDNADILQRSNRAALERVVSASMGLLDQVFVCATKDPSEMTQARAPDGWTVVYVDREDDGKGRLVSRARVLDPAVVG